MALIALHTRLRPGAEAEYDRVHAVVPDPLDREIRASGVTAWHIWRDGLDLFHAIEVVDFSAMEEHMSGLPVSAEWSRLVHPLLDLEASRSGPLRLVWRLP